MSLQSDGAELNAKPKHQGEWKCMSLRLPLVVSARISKAVEVRRQDPGSWKFSINDWMIEAAREKLDGVIQSAEVEVVRGRPEPTTTSLFPGTVGDLLKSGLVTKGVGSAQPVNWKAEYARIQKKYGEDAVGAAEEFEALMVEHGVTKPNSWARRTIDQRLAWLEATHPWGDAA
jgi:hypothetical protein